MQNPDCAEAAVRSRASGLVLARVVVYRILSFKFKLRLRCFKQTFSPIGRGAGALEIASKNHPNES